MPLTREQQQQLKEQLLSRWNELNQMLRTELAESGNDQAAGLVRDRGEEAFADLLREVDLEIVRIDVAELSEIKAAVQNMEEGYYGTCRSCGAEIPFARLAVQPTASRCITCQAKLEAGSQEE